MLQIIFRETVSLFTFISQTLNFILFGFIAFWDWIYHLSPPMLKSNEIWAQLGFFSISLLFSPFPWWTSFVFIFLPPMWSVFILIGFCFIFILSFPSGIVFL